MNDYMTLNFSKIPTDKDQLRRSYSTIIMDKSLEKFQNPYDALTYAAGLITRNGLLDVRTEMPIREVRTLIEATKFFVTNIRTEDNIWYIEARPDVSVEIIKIYAPPGLGDILWSLHKLRAIREREHPCKIHFVVCANQFEGRRSFDFLNNCAGLKIN